MQNGLKDQLLRRLRQYIGQEKTYHRDGLRDHQVVALDRALAFLSLHRGETYGIAYTDDGTGKEEGGRKIDDFFEVVSATGTGKTRMMGCLAKACDVPALFLTPRNVINDQTRKEFCEEVGLDPAEVGVYDSKQPAAAKARAVRQKYLITTYQSLPALLRQFPFADPGSDHYRPLVLLDEAHTARGPQTVKAVKGFLRKCIVGGFTATEAGERQALFEGQPPIVQLRIVPAIENDLLCEGIRTGVIDVRIDEQWVKDFKPPGAGQEFREEDIARFVGNPAVIRGAIDFHFNEDPGHLDRLDMGGPLHRFPTIFYTQGVDAARRGAELFNQTAAALGKPARADYVSGAMPKAEREAKLRAFRAGELAALWNDSVLEMGFDDRNATVGYLLRPTRVPHRVEQPLGRFARKPADDYAGRFYPDGSRQGKVALAINVRAPAMNPLLFGEVLGGRAAVYSRSRPQPSRSKRRTLGRPWPDGIEVHIDYDDVTEVVTRSAAERTPDRKPEGYWSGAELGEAIRGNEPDLETPQIVGRKIVQTLRKQLATQDEATYLGVRVPKDAIRTYQSQGLPAYAIRANEARAIVAARAARGGGVPTGYWSSAQLGERIVAANPTISSAKSAGLHVISSIRQQFDTGAGTHAAYLGVTVPRDALATYTYRGLTAYALREDVCRAVLKALDARTQRQLPDGYWTGPMLAARIKEATPATAQTEAVGYNIIARLRAMLRGSDVATYKGVAVPRSAIREYDNAGSPAYALRASECEQIVSRYAAEAEMTLPAGFWTGAQLSSAIAQANPKLEATSLGGVIIRDVRKQLLAGDSAVCRGVTVPREAVREYVYNGKPAVAMREAECRQIVAAYAQVAGTLRYSDAASKRRPTPKRNIKPDSSDLHRTGGSQGRCGED